MRLAVRDGAPWALVALALVLGLAGMTDAWSEGLCGERVSPEGISWSNHPLSLWPPGSSCTVTFPDGREVLVESSSWLPVVGAALGGGVVAVGYLRPLSPSWRRAALAATVPGVVGGLVVGAMAGPDGWFNVAGVVTAVALVLAVPVALVVAALRYSGGSGEFARTYFVAWPLAAAGLGALVFFAS